MDLVEVIAIVFFAAALGSFVGCLFMQGKLVEVQKHQRALEASSRVLEEERHVLELIARGASVTEVLDALTRAIERMVPGSICSVLLVDEARNCLEQAAAPNLPPAYWELCRELPVAQDFGCCPAAVFANKTVITEDIATDFRWTKIRELALRFDLHSCWSVPIRDSQNQSPLGAFAMYHHHPAKPTPLDLSVVHAGAHLAGNAIERLRAQQRLREYKERFQLAEKAASLGIWQWDSKTGIFTLSEGAAAISGIAENQCRLTLEQLHATIHPEDSPKLTAAREEIFAKGGVYDVEYRRIFPDGTVRWFRNRSSAQFVDGIATEVVGAVIEITSQKVLQFGLEKAKDSAEKALQARSQFLANMSHEIRTPMNAVMGMTSLLLDMDLPSDAKDYINTIRTSSDALLSIINDILDFTKIESGKLDLEHIPISLYDCLEEAVELLAPQCTEKGLELSLDIDSRIKEWIYGDSTRLRQIVVNLLANAVKFTESGEVVVRARKLIIPGGNKQIHIAVQDTGIGIAASKLDKLFQSFTQVDTSTTRKFGGTGLGLAISRRLCELLGGRMWVESHEGVGSTFQFTIPYEPAAAQKLPPATPKDWLGKRVLIIDDNLSNRQTLLAALAQWKLSPTAASSAQQALAEMHANVYDLVLVNWRLPGMDAAEWVRLAQAEFGSATPPMILLSAVSSSAREIRRNEDTLFAAVIPKPVRRQQIHRALLRVLNGVSEQTSSITKNTEGLLAVRAPLRILLADDNLVNQKVATRLLERWGYRPDVASNGLEVLDALHRQSYDVVLLDVQMPEMDGLEAASRICSEWDSAQRPLLVALTAGAMKEDRDKCLGAGMDNYLTKPLNVQELRLALENCHAALQSRHSLAQLNRQFGEPTLTPR